MSEATRETKFASLIVCRKMGIGEKKHVTKFAEEANIGIGDVLPCVKFIIDGRYDQKESFGMYITDDLEYIVKEKCFADKWRDMLFDREDNIAKFGKVGVV
jgi:hypothetical protein